MYLTSSFITACILATPALAFWRLPCVAPLVQERADPIINPGKMSGHLHTIMGGNGFDFTMDYSSTQASTCSSCTVQGDFSNYWTPVLFYQHQDGTFEKVDQIGGATVYYLQRNAPNENVTAFPKGFRMIAGDPFKRSGGSDAASQAISYHCLDYSGPDRPETGAFPTSNCPNGIRSQVFFPSCWDGVNLDSPDHKSHVSYPDGAYNAGTCPSSHPVRLIAIFYEIIWDTNKFASQWYGNNQPFVWSMGDPTGYGFHGDFVNGWDVDLLQKAATTCTNLSGRVEDCPLFKLTPDANAGGCKVPDQVNEPITGVLKSLPGCNPVQSGPAAATVASGAACSAAAQVSISAVSASQYFTDLTSKGWAYIGCATDNYYNRSLTQSSTSGSSMTNEGCTAYCQSKGYAFAGSEYADECYCGNTFPQDRLPVSGIVGNCNMACAGNSSQWCGGAGLMNLYQRCSGSSCVNAKVGAFGQGLLSSSSTSTTATAPGTRKVPSATMTTTARQNPKAASSTSACHRICLTQSKRDVAVEATETPSAGILESRRVVKRNVRGIRARSHAHAHVHQRKEIGEGA